MECVHDYIFAPYRVCQLCGEIDDDVVFEETQPNLMKMGKLKPNKNEDVTFRGEALTPTFVRDGQCEVIELNNRTIRIRADWSAKRILIATSRIRYICKNLNAEFLIPTASEKCIEWLKSPWTVDPKDPHTKLYQSIAYTSVWFAMRKFHFPMTFKRFLDIISEFGTIVHFQAKFLRIVEGLQIEFPPHDLSQITANFCEQFHYDAVYQNYLHQVTDKTRQFNNVLIQRATKIAKQITNCRGNPQIMGLTIMVYTAVNLQKYLIKKNMGKELPVSDIIGDARFKRLYGVGRNYINTRIKNTLSDLQRCSHKLEA